MDRKRSRGFTVLMVVLTVALVCLAVFFIAGMSGLIGDAPSKGRSDGTLNGQPLTVSWMIDGDGMATFRANVPADVTDVENIEWMEVDEVDGKQQSLFHEGPTETELSIRPKTEGTTTITTVVTTTSGEVASTETVVNWEDVQK